MFSAYFRHSSNILQRLMLHLLSLDGVPVRDGIHSNARQRQRYNQRRRDEIPSENHLHGHRGQEGKNLLSHITTTRNKTKKKSKDIHLPLPSAGVLLQ
jgi:hypothetical protein